MNDDKYLILACAFSHTPDKGVTLCRLVLERIKLTDFYEYHVYIERLEPKNDYMKTLMRTKSWPEANDVFHQNAGWPEPTEKTEFDNFI